MPQPHLAATAHTYGKMHANECMAKCLADPECNSVVYDLPPRNATNGDPPDPSVLGTCNTSNLSTLIMSSVNKGDDTLNAFDHISTLSWVRAPAAGAPLYAVMDGIEASIEDCATVLPSSNTCTAVSDHQELCKFGGSCYGRCQMLSNAYDTCSAQCDENDKCLGFTLDAENQFCALIPKTPALVKNGLNPKVLHNKEDCVARRYLTYVKTQPSGGYNTALVNGQRIQVSKRPKKNVNRLAILIASLVALAALAVLLAAMFAHKRRLDVGRKGDITL